MDATAISSPTRTVEIVRDSPVAIVTVSDPAKQEEDEEEDELLEEGVLEATGATGATGATETPGATETTGASVGPTGAVEGIGELATQL